MKLRSVIAAGMLCSLLFTNSSAQQLEQGTHVISPGFGIGGVYPVFSSVNAQSPLFGVSYEYGAFDHIGPGSIGIGGFAGYKAFKRTVDVDGFNFDERLHYFVIGAKGSWHYNPFPEVKGLDPYAGVMLSLNLPGYSSNYTEPYQYLENKYSPYLAATIYAGARYYFSEYVGAFAEAGFGTSFFAMGMNFRF